MSLLFVFYHLQLAVHQAMKYSNLVVGDVALDKGILLFGMGGSGVAVGTSSGFFRLFFIINQLSCGKFKTIFISFATSVAHLFLDELQYFC
ncbi:MAG: hypothetical protein EXX96DRAFT_545984 [Benjaminiella poitrasii]|nr:MAG: hypothetical protein EXX96DRAFT_545984 [Benjaminiella poitrasii]